MESNFFPHSFECAYYRRGEGHCTRGASCNFVHAQLTEGLSRVGFSMLPIRPRPVNPSSYWHGQGEYSQAGPANNTWSRSNTPVAPRQVEAEQPVAQDEVFVPEEAWVRALKGAYITFGPGATVASVALPWDASAVRISHLPKDSHKSSIAAYLSREMGFEIPEANIDPLPSSSGQNAADITMEDPGFAQRLIAAMTNDATCELSGEHVVPSHHRAARFDTMSRNKVSCSWHKPSRTITLTFATRDTAWEVYSRFAHGDYRVCQSRVRPTRPQPGDGAPSATTWKLKVDHVPASASRKDILDEIDNRNRPLTITLGWASYSNPIEASVDQITKRLLMVGPLDPTVTTSTDSQSRRSKLTVRFVDVRHAEEAVQRLNEMALPFYAHGKLTVQQVTTIRTRIPAHVYAAASQDIEALYGSWKLDFVYTNIAPEHKGFRKIKFEGQLHDKVVDAHAAFARVVAGELLTEDGAPLWSASFATNAWAYNQMRDMEQRLGVLVLCDRQQRTLRLLGPRDVLGAARAELARLCHLDPRAEFTISLDPADAAALPWLLAGGYRQVRDLVGRDKVALDVASQPRRLVVSGSEADLQVAQMLWNGRHRQPAAAAAADTDVAAGSPGPLDCSLCGFEVEHPVYTRCRHMYCAACYEAMCLSCAGTPARTPAVRCYGDGGGCKELLTLTAIAESLSSAALERVFVRMLTTFLSANSDQYRHCPTSACEQVYRVDPRDEGVEPEDEFQFQCPECNVAICSRCHVSHDTIHCPLLRLPEPDSMSCASED